MEAVLEEIYQCIIDGDQKITPQKVQEALDAGLQPGTILNEGMVRAMSEVGRLFEEGEYYVPEMLIAARAMQAGLAVLKPRMVDANIQLAGKVVAGTVKGDLHDIGKNLVCMMLEGAAFEIIDLGSDVPAEKFIEAVEKTGANIVAMSALLTTTMPNICQSGLGAPESPNRWVCWVKSFQPADVVAFFVPPADAGPNGADRAIADSHGRKPVDRAFIDPEPQRGE
jgi:5-methyltetrahydrofolate--homocysteine methyltransferase